MTDSIYRMGFVTRMRRMVCQTTPDRSALRVSQAGSFLLLFFILPKKGFCIMPFEVRGRYPLDAIVNVRLTTDEKDRLKEDADLAGMTVSELVRRRYFGRPIIAHADIVMIRELRRLGGLLKHLYTSSNGENSQETLAILNALRAAIEAISNDHQKG